MNGLLAILVASVSIAVGSTSAAEFSFVDVSTQSGIGPYTMANGLSAGAAAADFDNDGDIDIFVPTAQGIPDQLYRNLGNGQFEEIAATVGLNSTEPDEVGIWFDFDGDGDLDLAVARASCKIPCTSTLLRLYRQDAGPTFEDVTVASGLSALTTTQELADVGALAAGDLNNDGFLDLHLGFWEGPGFLFKNNGDGSFSDISSSSGLAGVRSHWQSIMFDFNRDGWLDILQLIDFLGNILWINQQDMTFVDAAPAAGLDNAMNDMGVSLGDYDNDGDFDVYVTNILRIDRNNVFLRNDSTEGSLNFTEISQALAVANGGFGWGTTFLDADNDTRLDLAATNGNSGTFVDDVSRFFHNVGGNPVGFNEISDEVQFNDTDWGSSLIAFDYDRDGDLDLLQTCNLGGPLRLRRNDRIGTAANNNHLVIRPRTNGPNTHAIGAVVRVTVGATTMSRLITAGTSHLGQEPAEAFFGLGAATIADIVVEWPDGSTTAIETVSANQVMTIVQGDVQKQTVPATSNLSLLAMLAGLALVAKRLGPRHS